MAILSELSSQNKSSAVSKVGDRLATMNMSRKVGVCCAPFRGEWLLCPFPWGAGSPSYTVAWAEAYLCPKWYPDPSSRLATTDMGRKVAGVLCPFPWGELGPHLTQCGLGLG